MEERLARIEEKQDALKDMIERHFHMQAIQNKECSLIRDRVLAIDASKNTFKWLLGAIGTIVVSLSGFIAWVFSQIKQ